MASVEADLQAVMAGVDRSKSRCVGNRRRKGRAIPFPERRYSNPGAERPAGGLEGERERVRGKKYSDREVGKEVGTLWGRQGGRED